MLSPYRMMVGLDYLAMFLSRKGPSKYVMFRSSQMSKKYVLYDLTHLTKLSLVVIDIIVKSNCIHYLEIPSNRMSS
jgi:hypothetical protein